MELAHQASRIALQNIVKEELTRKIFYQKGLPLAVQACPTGRGAAAIPPPGVGNAGLFSVAPAGAVLVQQKRENHFAPAVAPTFRLFALQCARFHCEPSIARVKVVRHNEQLQAVENSVNAFAMDDFREGRRRKLFSRSGLISFRVLF